MAPIINDRCVKMARLTRSADSKTSRFCLPCLLAQGRVFLTTKGVTGIRAVHKGKEFTIRARTVVLAAGAYMTPRLLLKSSSPTWPDGLASRSAMVGRSLMLHNSDLMAVDSPQSAAWLQLMQSANAESLSTADGIKLSGYKLLGWYPGDAGWLSCALQFAGTLLFNINTFHGMSPGLDWVQQDLHIWLQNMFGSIFFLASGYLAFVETCHRSWAWLPHLLSWRITFVNLLGCIFLWYLRYSPL